MYPQKNRTYRTTCIANSAVLSGLAVSYAINKVKSVMDTNSQHMQRKTRDERSNNVMTYLPQQTAAMGMHPFPHTTSPISQLPVARTLTPPMEVRFEGSEGRLLRGMAPKRARVVRVLSLTIFGSGREFLWKEKDRLKEGGIEMILTAKLNPIERESNR